MRIKKAEKMKNTLISLTNCRFLGLGKLNVRVKQEFYSYGISDLTEKKKPFLTSVIRLQEDL